MKRDGLFCRLEPDDTFFFLHLPKTAGTTLRVYLESRFDPALTCPAYNALELAQTTEAERQRCRFFRGHFPYTMLRHLLNRPFVTITFLRDPVERVLSHYSFLCHEKNRGWRSRDVIASLKEFSLEAFLESPLLRWAASDHQTRLLAGDHPDLSTRPDPADALEILAPDPADNIRLATARLHDMPFVGITERFDESIDLLNSVFGWPDVTPLQPLLMTPERLRSPDVPPRLLDRIIELNQQDIAVYAAARQLFDERLEALRRSLSSGVLPSNMDYREEIFFAFDRHLSLFNWHQPETTRRGRRFCWMAATESHLDFTLRTDHDVRVEFCVQHTLAPDVLESLTLLVNQHPVALSRRRRGRRFVFRGQVSVEMLRSPRRYTRLTFRVNRTLSPADLDPTSPDTRQLGLALNWISVAPARKRRWLPF